MVVRLPPIQLYLQVENSRGSVGRKAIFVNEAKLYRARKPFVGTTSKHDALGSLNPLVGCRAKQWLSNISMLVIDNGKAFFQKDGTLSLTGATGAGLGKLIASQWPLRNRFIDHNLEELFHVSERPSGIAVISFRFHYSRGGLDSIPAEMEAFKSCLPLKPVCVLCTSNIQTPDGEEKEYVEYEARNSDSLSSSDSFKTVSSTSCEVSQKDEKTGTSSIASKNIQQVNSTPAVSQRADSPLGWPLLKSVINVNKPPSPRSAAREMSVVEWALQLPDRRATITRELPLKTDLTQEGCNNISEIQVSSKRILIQKPSTESRFLCNDKHKSREEEHSLTKKLRQLCKGKTCKEFTYQELQSATSRFSAARIIGTGGSSRVYRGVLPDGQSVAVKLLNSSPEAEQELLLEVEIMVALQNKHIVSLIGYCVEGQKCLLVYNFLFKGNLEENLHGGKEKSVLPWTHRLKVALGIAEAIDYLHEGCSCPVIHRDVKSSNILLSEDFEPQLSDFGLAKWASPTAAHITCSDVVGTFGYLAPEYFMYGKVNEKTDVYSFGVVLLELITGRQPINTKNPKGQESLVMWARPLLLEGSLKELADPRLEDAYDANEMQRMMLSAALCIRQASQFRPRMSRILKLLRGGEDDLTYWAKRQLAMSKDIDELVEDEYGANYGSCNIRTHLTLAMLGVDDDVGSVSSPDQSVDLSQANKSLEDYLCGRYSRSSSFD